MHKLSNWLAWLSERCCCRWWQHRHIYAVLAALAAASSVFCFWQASEYRRVPKMAIPDPTQFMAVTGFWKKMTLLTTTTTRFIVLDTENEVGDSPWPSTM